MGVSGRIIKRFQVPRGFFSFFPVGVRPCIKGHLEFEGSKNEQQVYHCSLWLCLGQCNEQILYEIYNHVTVHNLAMNIMSGNKMYRVSKNGRTDRFG